MRLQSLSHLLEVARAIAHPRRIIILGSSSLLVQHPELGSPGQPLELTMDADLLLEPVNEAIAETLQIAAGQDSAFMAEFGYYADILRPDIVNALPTGWESRLYPVAGYENVFALDVYDLAMVKLVLGRLKDLELLRALLRLGILEPTRLQRHYQEAPLNERDAFAAGRNLGLLLANQGTT